MAPIGTSVRLKSICGHHAITILKFPLSVSAPYLDVKLASVNLNQYRIALPFPPPVLLAFLAAKSLVYLDAQAIYYFPLGVRLSPRGPTVLLGSKRDNTSWRQYRSSGKLRLHQRSYFYCLQFCAQRQRFCRRQCQWRRPGKLRSSWFECLAAGPAQKRAQSPLGHNGEVLALDPHH